MHKTITYKGLTFSFTDAGAAVPCSGCRRVAVCVISPKIRIAGSPVTVRRRASCEECICDVMDAIIRMYHGSRTDQFDPPWNTASHARTNAGMKVTKGTKDGRTVYRCGEKYFFSKAKADAYARESAPARKPVKRKTSHYLDDAAHARMAKRPYVRTKATKAQLDLINYWTEDRIQDYLNSGSWEKHGNGWMRRKK